jgi:hypothetical protein
MKRVESSDFDPVRRVEKVESPIGLNLSSRTSTLEHFNPDSGSAAQGETPVQTPARRDEGAPTESHHQAIGRKVLARLARQAQANRAASRRLLAYGRLAPMDMPATSAAPLERLLTEEDLARLLHVELQQVERLRVRREGPPVVRVAPRTIRYRPADVERWLASRTQMPTEHRGAMSMDRPEKVANG